MTKDRWELLCKNHIATEILRIEKIGGDTISKYTERFGIAPYRKCRGCGMQPKDLFKSPGHRYCFNCEPVQQQTYDNGVDMKWLKEWSKLATQPWLDRDCFLRNHNVQGAW